MSPIAQASSAETAVMSVSWTFCLRRGGGIGTVFHRSPSQRMIESLSSPLRARAHTLCGPRALNA